MSNSQPSYLLNTLEELEGLRDPSRSADSQRQFERFRVRGDAELHPADRGRMDREPLEIQLRDIGRGGLGFITTRRLEPGSSWRASFRRQSYVIAEQECIVRHCRSVGAGLYLVGAQFVVSTGLLTLLGVDASATAEHDAPDEQVARDEEASFLPPADVA
jgi:hypothetical protein